MAYPEAESGGPPRTGRARMPHSPQFLSHFRKPRNVGRLEAPTAIGRQGRPGQGNYMVIHIQVQGEQIAEIRYQTYGCSGAIACGSVVTEQARGKSLAEAAEISASDVDEALGELPANKRHCVDLAVGALRNALEKASQVARGSRPSSACTQPLR